MTVLAVIAAVALLAAEQPAPAPPPEKGAGRDAPVRDPDAEIVENLELLERLEVLEHLDVLTPPAPLPAPEEPPAT